MPVAENELDPSKGFWKKALASASPSMLRGGAGMSLFIGATRWVPDTLPGALETYVDYALIVFAGIAALQTSYGMLTGK